MNVQVERTATVQPIAAGVTKQTEKRDGNNRRWQGRVTKEEEREEGSNVAQKGTNSDAIYARTKLDRQRW